MPSHYFCLSVRQPWADLIVDGIKDVENRTWGTDFRGLLLIHASQTVDEEAIPPLVRLLGVRSAADYEPVIGAIIGFTILVDCVTASSSPYFSGPYGFVVKEPQRFPEPIPLPGRLGIFRVPAQVLRQHGCDPPLVSAPKRAPSWY